jgi:hypothetical protein
VAAAAPTGIHHRRPFRVTDRRLFDPSGSEWGPPEFAGVSLRGVQIAARHADPRTIIRYDRARKNLDRHPNYILAAFMASGT